MRNKYLNPPQMIMFLYMGILLIAAAAVDINLVGLVNDALI